MRQIRIRLWLLPSLAALVLCLALLTLSGCEAGWFGAGAGSGITIDRMLDQQEQNAIDNLALLAEKNVALEKLIAETTDPLDKAKLQEALAENRRFQKDIALQLDAIKAMRQGIATDWQDPVTVSGMAALLASLVGNYFQRKKAKTLTDEVRAERTEHLALNAGVTKFYGTNAPEIASKLYDLIKEAKTRNGIT